VEEGLPELEEVAMLVVVVEVEAARVAPPAPDVVPPLSEEAIVPAVLLHAWLENTHDRGVVETLHDFCPTPEPVYAYRIACQVRMQNLDGYLLSALLVEGEPHGTEATLSEWLDQSIALFPEVVPSRKLPSVTHLALELHDLVPDLARVLVMLLEPPFPDQCVLEFLAQRAHSLIQVRWCWALGSVSSGPGFTKLRARLLFRVLLPLPQQLYGETRLIVVDELATILAQPDPVFD
jgi:hypothetical protein